jgi:hypothetical protein
MTHPSSVVGFGFVHDLHARLTIRTGFSLTGSKLAVMVWVSSACGYTLL